MADEVNRVPNNFEEPELRGYFRAGYHSYYLEIAYKSLIEHQGLITELDRLKAYGGFEYENNGSLVFIYHHEEEVQLISQAMTKEAIKFIVFLAMYCEAYIWDLGASVMGNNFCKTYVDKLDSLSKWVVIPKLITGKELNRGHICFAKLKELIQWRNMLVHAKSIDARQIFKDHHSYLKYTKPIHEHIDLEEIFEGIKSLFEELNKIDPQGYHRIRVDGQLNAL